jgi:toxin FitB
VILLDTNVVSEALKPEPHPAVRPWLDAQAAETLFLPSIAIAELLFGVGVLPEGLRKALLAARIEALLGEFEGRILPFGAEAARRYAELAVRARAAGRGFPTPDGYIAAIAAARGFAVATRNASAFRAAGVGVVDPWVGGG